MSVEIKLKKPDKVYIPGEVVRGCIVIVSPSGSMSHQGISLTAEGSVQLQLSARSVGIFEGKKKKWMHNFFFFNKMINNKF